MTAISTKPQPMAPSGSAFGAALGGLLAIAAGIGVGRFVYTPILPPMVQALHLSQSAAGLIASANFLGYLIGALVAALPRLPGSRRAWVLGALAVSAATTAAMGSAATFAEFLGLRLAGGAASAFVLIIGSTLVLECLAQAGRSGLSALHFAGVGSGIAISAALVAGLLAFGESWRVLWWASGALAAVAFVAVALLLPSGTASAGENRSHTGAAIGAQLRRLIVAYGLYGFGYVITATFIVAIVRATPTIRTLEPVIWVIFGLSAAPSIGAWTWIAGRAGLPNAFAIACIVEAAGVLASVVWQTAAGIFLAAILVGGTFMGLTALGLIWARQLAPGDPRRALAMVTGAFGLGQIIGPAFAGALSDRLGSFLVPSIAAAIALLAAAALARWRAATA